MKSLAVKTTLGIALFSTTLLGPLSASGRAQDLSTISPEAIGQNWYELSPQERSRALENYHRFQKLPPDRQHRLEEQYNRWQQLPSEERDRIRNNYDRYRGMNSDQKEDFLRKYKTWRSQPR